MKSPSHGAESASPFPCRSLLAALLLVCCAAAAPAQIVTFSGPEQFRLGPQLDYGVALEGPLLAIGGVEDGQLLPRVLLHRRSAAQPLVWQQVAELQPDDVTQDERLGYTLAMDGSTIVAGAWGFDGPGGADTGRVHVFERDPADGSWPRVAVLTAPDGQAGQEFGATLAISGDTIAVGTERDPYNVYLFQRDPVDRTQWHLATTIPPRPGCRSIGAALALDGDTLATLSRDRLACGGVYVYERDPLDPESWLFAAHIGTGDERNDMWVAVAVDGDVLVATAPEWGDDRGAAFVFTRDPADPMSWNRSTLLVSPQPEQGYVRDFGDNAAVAGDTIVIGSPGDYHPDYDDAFGSVHVYRRAESDPQVWRHLAKIFGQNSAPFGEAVALDPAGDAFAVASVWSEGSVPLYVMREQTIDPRLTVSGECPGELVLRAEGMTPFGPVRRFRGSEPGQGFIEEGHCAGTEIGLADRVQLGEDAFAEPDGVVESPPGAMAPDGFCGGYAQVLDLTTCATSEVVPIP